ncbi:MAG TPA: sulfide/dihydroorotate dehydrogenase-like FAD/NAD-binding protein [Tepidisphaeraceae bacterium]|nr:sulfide/dihydroorotate dehydrogenase-like FAD/NAD-binding protein [Tepidisphaeraceae bacterium]
MGYRVLQSDWLAPAVRRLVVEAPHVTRHCGPGQFVIVRATANGERIPLTIAHVDRASKTITLIVQAVGLTTTRLCALKAGEMIADVAGPMGQETEIDCVGHTVVVGGGVGTAVIYPQATALKAKGNTVSAIIGGRSRLNVILQRELCDVCDAVYPCTDDGSHGFKGFVTQRLEQLIVQSAETHSVKLVLCAGPVPMMRAVAELTRPLRIRTIASLNPIMVDGTGMCGGCRISVGGETKFACVDGPEFDAHKVDFKVLIDRLASYREHERHAQERHADEVTACRGGNQP